MAPFWAPALPSTFAVVVVLVYRRAILPTIWRLCRFAFGTALLLLTTFTTWMHGITSRRQQQRQGSKVAVLGGGIAGFGCAHALCNGGGSVDLFEACDEVGGNAKTHKWPDGPVTGLSVLAWPKTYFRNYGALLKRLGLETRAVTLKFFLRRRRDGEAFVHGRDSELSRRYADDFRRWGRAVEFVRSCNRYFAASDVQSLYHFSLFNPMNVLPLRWLCALYGISSGFWQEIITPLHCTTFLTTSLDDVPALVVPTISDLIPLDETPTLESWVGSSRQVFDGIAHAAGAKLAVHTGCAVERVRQEPDGTWTLVVRRPDGTVATFGGYARVVFASNAPNAAAALPSSWAWWGVRLLLGAVEYSDATCPMFRVGVIHSDASVFPADARDEVCASCCNYIEGYQAAPGDPPAFENTFVLSSWYPSVWRAPGDERPIEGDGRPRLVSYGLRDPGSIKGALGEVHNRTNHPALSPLFLATSMLLRLVQGREGVYFCGSMATPGNGHDLSLCSGLAIAAAIGAPYPFPENEEAADDLARLRRILGV